MSTNSRGYGAKRIYAEHSWVSKKIDLPLEKFIHDKIWGAMFLVAAAVIALIWANSPWSEHYFRLLKTMVPIQIGSFSLSMNVHHWINDGLMALFFLSVGLEIKREFVYGELSDPRKAMLPVVAALGGMIIPILFFISLNRDAETIHGWAIPVATDIAFALGIITLLGKRIPSEARIFLLTLATVDDIGGILIIALFYAHGFSLSALLMAFLVFAIIFLLTKINARIQLVCFLGFVFWYFFRESGIHATIAGVMMGLVIPAKAKIKQEVYEKKASDILSGYQKALANNSQGEVEMELGKMEALTLQTESPLNYLARAVDPFVSYVVLPLFALANCGVHLPLSLLGETFVHPVTWGIVLGLIFGKTIGVFSFSWGILKLKLADMPQNLTFRHLLGVGLICGIGFTVSLFIVELAYKSEPLISFAKVGVFTASVLAALFGYLFLRFEPKAGKK